MEHNMRLIELQKRFNKLNFTTTLSEDGIMGNKTRKSVELFVDFFGYTKIIDSLLEEKRLRNIPVQYITQRGTYKYSSRMCSVACILMVENYFNAKGKKIDQSSIIELDKEIDNNENLREWATSKKLKYYIDNDKLEQVSAVMAFVLEEKTGFEFNVEYKTIEDIKALLVLGIPMIASTRFPGRKHNNMKAGHYIVLNGAMGNNYSIMDPYGMWENFYDATADVKTKGENVVIPEKELFGTYGCKSQKDDKVGKKRSDKYRVIVLAKKHYKSVL